MTAQKTGYIFAFLAFTVFACQDAISKHLAHAYSPLMITMIRYWAFAGFVTIVAARSRKGLTGAIRANRPYLQILRGVLLASQIMVTILSFRVAGLIQSQAIFSATPLVVAMLSVPILGEVVGWRRWTAIGVGMVGVLIILQPNPATFDLTLLIPLASAMINAAYSVATRLASRTDDAGVSFFYTGIAGAALATAVGPFFWTNMQGWDWGWMALLCLTGISSHYCLIKAYDHLDAVLVQPIAYYQLMLSAFIGVFIFGESLKTNIVIGSLIIVAAGLFTLWREAARRRMPVG
ncbi:DMT family transporter [Rhizobium sp. FKL33]|uniref:DMT family transporter n=1 Tax=Rhizobium sp. FKL33 TaxID=2562307 RepID=UPI0010C04DC0|nr:DMT family transporter [Rhizobium sp. FKL33]